MRLIDADKLAEWYSQTHGVSFFYASDCLVIKEIVECAPTADAEPVVDAHWVFGSDGYGNDHYYCSFCLNDALNDDDGEWCLSERCPHCGAKMDGGAEKNE